MNVKATDHFISLCASTRRKIKNYLQRPTHRCLPDCGETRQSHKRGSRQGSSQPMLEIFIIFIYIYMRMYRSLWGVCGCRSVPRCGSLAPVLATLPLTCLEYASIIFINIDFINCDETRQSHKHGSRRGSLQLCVFTFVDLYI